MRRVVITGTDTGVGKTVFAAALARHWQARYWKPVQAGLDEETDSELVSRLAGVAVLPEAHRLTTPCSPHEAARRDGVTLDRAKLALPQGDGPLVVEGAGGALVPMGQDWLAADLFADWGLPAIIVARTALGTINHTLLTIEALRSRGVPVMGVALIGEKPAPGSAEAIADYGQVAVLGRLPPIDPLNGERLAAAFSEAFDL